MPRAAYVIVAFIVFALHPSVRAESADPSGSPPHLPHAVLLNLSESDLNRILVDWFEDEGGHDLTGRQRRSSRGMTGVRYHAALGAPQLTLGDEGRAHLDIDLHHADFRVAALERRLAGARLRCEDFGVRLSPDEPLKIGVDLRFTVEDGGVWLTTEDVTADLDRRDLAFDRPARCRHAFIPGWLLWRLGRPALARKIEHLDEVILARARRAGDRAQGVHGLLRERLVIPGRTEENAIELRPTRVATSDRALWVALDAGPSAPASGVETVPTSLPAPSAERSYVALSQQLLDAAIAQRFPAGTARHSAPGSDLTRLFRSSALYALVPGMRDVDQRDGLALGFRFHRTPQLEFSTVDATTPRERAALALTLTDVEIEWTQIHEGERVWLGTVRVERAEITVAPFVGPLGGVSFELIDNAWSLTSSGIEFNEPLLAATLQELVFAEVFATKFDPLLRRPMTLASTPFELSGFRRSGDYLLVEFAPAPAAPSTTPAPSLEAEPTTVVALGSSSQAKR